MSWLAGQLHSVKTLESIMQQNTGPAASLAGGDGGGGGGGDYSPDI